MVFGPRRPPAPSPDASIKTTGVREVLEELLVPALSRTPCLVAFSGGRDSSALLAMATRVARRARLEPPVPITLRLKKHPRTWESEWQEETVRYLGLDDWEIISLDYELDTLG